MIFHFPFKQINAFRCIYTQVNASARAITFIFMSSVAMRDLGIIKSVLEGSDECVDE